MSKTLKQVDHAFEKGLHGTIATEGRSLAGGPVRRFGQIDKTVVRENNSVQRAGAIHVNAGSLDSAHRPNAIPIVEGAGVATRIPVDADPHKAGRWNRGSHLKNNT